MSIGEIASFIGYHRRRTAREPIAVPRTCQSCLEERLRRDCCCVCRAATTAQSRYPSAVLQYRIGVGLFKLLPALRHHVRHRVKEHGLEFVLESAPDVTNFQIELAGQLALNC